MYYLLLLYERLLLYFPLWLLRLVPDLLAPLAWLVAVGPRKQATKNVCHVLGADVQRTAVGRRKVRRIVRGMFRNSIRNYMDIFLLTREEFQGSRLYPHHRIHEEYLQEALLLGKGAIVFSLHLGPFAYLASWLASLGYEVTIPVEKLENERCMRLLQKRRNQSDVNYIPLGGSAPMRAILQALHRNQVVLITADRAVAGESMICDFFGAPARLPLGPVNLSLHTGAPLVGALGWYSSKTRVHADFMHVTLALSAEERQQPEALQRAIISELEQLISARPEQWIMFSKVWEDEPERG